MKTRNKIKKNKFTPLVIALCVVLIIYVLSFIYPLIWAFFTSMKSMEFWFTEMNPNALPPSISFKNYITVIGELPVKTATQFRVVEIGEMLFNTLLYVLGTAFFATISPCIMGYATGRFKVWFNKIITATVIVSMTLPIVGSTPSMLRIVKLLNIFDTQIGPWIMGMSYLGMFFLIFNAFFKSVPMEYTEAAQIDGASHFRIMTMIILPLSASTFLTVYLLNAISLWNNYQTTLMYMPSYPTIALGLYNFKFGGATLYTEPPFEMAGALLFAVPVVVIFSVFSDRIMGKVSVGGIKG